MSHKMKEYEKCAKNDGHSGECLSEAKFHKAFSWFAIVLLWIFVIGEISRSYLGI